jgi:hypothetical protein
MAVCHSELTCLDLVEHLSVILIGQLDYQQWHLAAMQLYLIYAILDQPAASVRESSLACSSGCERRSLILGAQSKWQGAVPCYSMILCVLLYCCRLLMVFVSGDRCLVQVLLLLQVVSLACCLASCASLLVRVFLSRSRSLAVHAVQLHQHPHHHLRGTRMA